ncbi:Imprinted and ancient [Hyphodiscus hymeniophilus]|uniref:Imprinted and ancient n=1 Tax=Hyphodiscus hymeniophilus TaxID=353542 RepID=A0A9P7AYI0_9HELO|nr:Imprinted and ancient [Hyphodiscus hymeniophilus]
MASQKDLQDLLRVLTTGRNKLPMLGAMGRVKALQGADLRSIESIASADLETISTALSDPKAAKSLQTTCKGLVKDPSKKRTADSTLSSTSKRTKSAYELNSEPQTPQEIEGALALPQPSQDEEQIEKTVIYTNRAPLVLAFAVQLLKYTMPEQPLSSRLSLAQAVVSVNSRSKAQSLGIEKGRSAEELGWGQGQPKVKVMGREISVLKRSGYEWKREKDEENIDVVESPSVGAEEKSQDTKIDPVVEEGLKRATDGWTVSASVTSKKSTFVARAISIKSPSQARSEVQKLLGANTDLREASHNITAWRVAGDYGVIEDSNDDGESGGGRHILGLLQSSDALDVLLVVTRWYGGIMLGVDRWRIMSQVSRDALSQRLRVTGVIGQEALWGLDLEAMKSIDAPVTGGTAVGMPIYRPEGARSYILKAFASPPAGEDEKKKKKTGVTLEREKENNLGLLLGALDMLFNSWVEHLSRDELDRKAWGWYVQVRPEVDGGVAGWGGKGNVKLADILDLRRKA